MRHLGGFFKQQNRAHTAHISFLSVKKISYSVHTKPSALSLRINTQIYYTNNLGRHSLSSLRETEFIPNLATCYSLNSAGSVREATVSER